MTDHLSRKKRSWNMSRISSKNTKPEMVVRRILTDLGCRYRLHVNKLPGKPDIVLKKHNLIIFCNGCFWHQHKNCKRANVPKSNRDYWIKKLDKNVERFKCDINTLKKEGWNVQIIWECELKDSNKLISKINKMLDTNKLRDK